VSVSEIDAALFADRVFSLTRKGALKLMSGQPEGDADVIPFPKNIQADGA
jgi:hypothetical protein